MNNTESNPAYSVDWFSGNIPGWKAVFEYMGYIGKDNLTFLEIGCFEGRATNFMLDEILTGNNTALHVVSGDILKKNFENEMFDFIYIDGSHTAYDVLQDAILAHPLLKKGGLVIFDDFGWKDPTNLHPTNSPELGITCFYNTYESFYNVAFTGYQVGLIKK